MHNNIPNHEALSCNKINNNILLKIYKQENALNISTIKKYKITLET